MRTDQYVEATARQFGGCPECHKSDGYLDVEREHWFICKEHKTKWCVGENLFSIWQWLSPADWEENAARLAEYREVEPWEPLRQTNSCEREAVWLYRLWSELEEAPELIWGESDGVDYIHSTGPITVMAKPGISREELVQRLRQLVDKIEVWKWSSVGEPAEPGVTPF